MKLVESVGSRTREGAPLARSAPLADLQLQARVKAWIHLH
jgi:hypothetical protein